MTIKRMSWEYEGEMFYGIYDFDVITEKHKLIQLDVEDLETGIKRRVV